jgi:hypothetical protein
MRLRLGELEQIAPRRYLGNFYPNYIAGPRPHFCFADDKIHQPTV